jgi:pimeloyl-ACP methyl ester carboxylesterase
MGSSMGGLISIYALCEYPDVFGGAAALSTHWIGSFERNAWVPMAAFEYLRANLPDPGDHRLYMDHGTLGLDALYGTWQAVIDQIVLDHGFTAANWQSRVFEGADHNEDDWGKRFEIPVRFLLAPPRVPK